VVEPAPGQLKPLFGGVILSEAKEKAEKKRKAQVTAAACLAATS
jgi:hypothetical protein